MYVRRPHVQTFTILLLLEVLGALRPAAAIAAPPDIVLYASDATTIRGAWTRTSSTSGAGGQLMTSADGGGSSTKAPLTAPQNYFEVPLFAEAHTLYRVWLRVRGSSNSTTNDSVWVQFSDSLDSTGSPVWRVGSSSALAVNLEACSGCGISGWGWADGAWWTGDYGVVKFPTRGARTIRIQTREDGAQVDQIVLSARTYFNAGPGGASNDKTIVPRSTVTSLPEVVLYAAEATRRSGNWALENDKSAAYGQRQGSTDYGWAQKTVPLRSPADFLEWKFSATAGSRYRVWLRLRAAEDRPTNDSVWVQFSDAVDKNGAARYRIGGASALPVGLEPCGGCGVSGWGWQRRVWWVTDTGDVYFPTTGVKTLRIQTREDGVFIDQVVISPSRYANAPPGAQRGDATLVTRDGVATAMSGASNTMATSADTATLAMSTSAASYQRSLSFAASKDHVSLVLSYKLDIFKQGTSTSTGKPSATLNLGKPPVVSGQIRVEIGSTVQALAPGTYVATVSAIGSAGVARSLASPAFSR